MTRIRAAGFTLLEILVSLAIMAALVAVVYPALNSKLRDARTATLAQTLLGFSQAIAEMKRATTMYPSSLSQLTTAPVANSSTNICGAGNTFTTAAAAQWRGPYVSREIPSGGVPAGDATINLALRRVTSASSTWLVMDVPSVETQVANDLETLFDGSTTNSSTTGTIQTGTPSDGLTSLSYYMPINSC
jgi:prepilin-type N-terminal cleavage/methylation domain-containing protein